MFTLRIPKGIRALLSQLTDNKSCACNHSFRYYTTALIDLRRRKTTHHRETYAATHAGARTQLSTRVHIDQIHEYLMIFHIIKGQKWIFQLPGSVSGIMTSCAMVPLGSAGSKQLGREETKRHARVRTLCLGGKIFFVYFYFFLFTRKEHVKSKITFYVNDCAGTVRDGSPSLVITLLS